MLRNQIRFLLQSLGEKMHLSWRDFGATTSPMPLPRQNRYKNFSRRSFMEKSVSFSHIVVLRLSAVNEAMYENAELSDVVCQSEDRMSLNNSNNSFISYSRLSTILNSLGMQSRARNSLLMSTFWAVISPCRMCFLCSCRRHETMSAESIMRVL